jgi:hypothetical protein
MLLTNWFLQAARKLPVSVLKGSGLSGCLLYGAIAAQNGAMACKMI